MKHRMARILVLAKASFFVGSLFVSSAFAGVEANKSFGPTNIAYPGQIRTVTINLINNDATSSVTNVAFTDELPAGLLFAASTNESNTCGGTLSFNSSSDPVSVKLVGGTLPQAPSSVDPGTCRITFDILAPNLSHAEVSKDFINTIEAGDISAVVGGVAINNTNPTSGTLSVKLEEVVASIRYEFADGTQTNSIQPG